MTPPNRDKLFPRGSSCVDHFAFALGLQFRRLSLQLDSNQMRKTFPGEEHNEEISACSSAHRE